MRLVRDKGAGTWALSGVMHVICLFLTRDRTDTHSATFVQVEVGEGQSLKKHCAFNQYFKAMYVGQCQAHPEYGLLISRNVEIEDECSSFRASGSKFYNRVGA